MAIGPRLDQRQSQSLVMTPQLQQAIKLLQLNNMELAEYVERELERNPLLERDESEREPLEIERRETAAPEADGGGPGAAPEAAIDADEPLQTMDLSNDAAPTLEADIDAEMQNLYTNDSVTEAAPEVQTDMSFNVSGAGGGGFDGEPPGLQQTLAASKSLREHLAEQIGMALTLPRERLIARDMLENVDDAGYLTAELSDIAARLSVAYDDVDDVLHVLQSLEPAGVFSRSLEECLATQLRERDRYDPAMAAMVENLDLVAKHDWRALREVCGVDDEDLRDMLAELRALQPKPGAMFSEEVAQIVVPDVLMRPKPRGGWIIELNPETLPRVLVNNQYYAEISDATQSRDDKNYVTEQFNAANWLVKALHQRATTILKVSRELARQQDAFFVKGVEHLKPLVLRNIADVIGMHESTVSRVTSNKFIATPRGIFELKYFFSASIASADGGEAHSAESVRHRIKSLIDDEPAEATLSDDRIAAILKDGGVGVARRTVAKYRESMGIPSSAQRRREKNAIG